MITTPTSIEKLELQMGIEHIKSMLKTKPCDDFIVIKNNYKVGAYLYFEYDLFKFAFADNDKQDSRYIKRLECSYFLEQLLDWFGHSFPVQQKKVKIKLWERLTGRRLYSNEKLQEATVLLDDFFNIIGFFIYGNLYKHVSRKFDKDKQKKLTMLTSLGDECFFLIADYLNSKYGDAYDKGGVLPTLKERKQKEDSVTDAIETKFDQFLRTKPAITLAADLEIGKYSLAAFTIDFDSSHNATYSWAADYLISEILVASGYKDGSVLKALKANVQILEDARIISESKFYQLFGCCAALIAKTTNQEFKLCTLRRLGKSCFLRLLEHLELG